MGAPEPGRKGASMATRTQAGNAGLDRYFHISERGSTVRTEIIAGLATFLTMSYIIFINPSIIGGLPDHQGTTLGLIPVATVTALVAGVITLAMGLYANYPFALAAGLGLNAFVAFGLVKGVGLSWPDAMGVIVLEGLVITLLVLTRFREAVLNAIPMDLKRSIGIGIGLFIAFIGLFNAGVVHGNAAVPPVGIVERFDTWPLLIFAVGLVVTSALVARKVRGALLIGILFTTVLATIVNEAKHLKVFTDGTAKIPHTWPGPTFHLIGHFSFHFWTVLGTGSAIAVVLSVMLSDFFDTMGTVIGIAGEAKLLDDKGRLPGINRVLIVDSLAAVAGGAASASSNTTYIESAAGVSEGGRTGLTAVVVGVLFLLCIFIAPIVQIVPFVATAPVLVIVGYFMMTMVKDVNWSDASIGIPALLTIGVMPFTYSITNGVGAGFISYAVIKILQGKWKDVSWLLYVVAAVFGWYFFHGVVG
jgi:AGZA family xanthine/uracil permease-like MFS transporter